MMKRFFLQGMKVESGASAGDYFYSRDHLGSIRELTDSGGNIRARYSYDPFGRRTLLTGDVDGDFGFAGMFCTPETNLNLASSRAYDPAIGRWLSRDPLRDAEKLFASNLYAYVDNNPVNWTDPSGRQKVVPKPPSDTPQCFYLGSPEALLDMFASCLRCLFEFPAAAKGDIQYMFNLWVDGGSCYRCLAAEGGKYSECRPRKPRPGVRNCDEGFLFGEPIIPCNPEPKCEAPGPEPNYSPIGPLGCRCARSHVSMEAQRRRYSRSDGRQSTTQQCQKRRRRTTTRYTNTQSR